MPAHRRAVLQVVAWTLLFAALIDVAINLAFRVPADPRQKPGTLANYFEYGRSVEAKLRRSLGPDDERAADIAVAGWIDRDCTRAVKGEPGRTTIAFYGMSFSNQVGDALAELDPSVHTVYFAGPSAPPNHSMGCFHLRQAKAGDAGDDPASVQVLGVLASSVKGLLSMTGATTGFEGPAPFTYPRYRLDDQGRLQATQPLVRSTADWREVMADPQRWGAFKQQLAQHDRFYDPLLFDAGVGDRSAIVRMLRRAWAQHSSRDLADSVLGPDGFSADPEIGPVLQALVLDFAQRSRAAGKRPVVLLLHDGQSGDALHRLLSPVLTAHGVDHVSTHEVAPTSDRANFIGDGHFTPLANLRIAAELRKQLARAPTTAPGVTSK
ncbi:hypothetical protein [Aquabacterium sp. J223]|uniref:hypothetical protein n=1 Tax=Aquabacterium sp. J223 TaxID=2898431 RepID=UPI0021ADCE12|nr:hypothetical protein [Aquabacterium sp. J223]UUX96833.1 hypothetical protein LRS07_06020 [Aquabacterium sp. J223]